MTAIKLFKIKRRIAKLKETPTSEESKNEIYFLTEQIRQALPNLQNKKSDLRLIKNH